MKAGTVEHIKFKRLKRALSLKDWQCIGLLESLWLYTARNHIDGAIGKSSNLDIALSIEWDDDEDSLIQKLIESGWLDECEESRLIIHDWKHHCPTYIKGNLAKHKRSFAKQVAKHNSKQVAKQVTKNDAEQTTKHCATYSSQAKPSQVNSSSTPEDDDYTIPLDAGTKELSKAEQAGNKKAMYEWLLGNVSMLDEFSLPYSSFLDFARAFKAPLWFVCDQLRIKICGSEIKDKRHTIGYVRKVWMEIDRMDGVK